MCAKLVLKVDNMLEHILAKEVDSTDRVYIFHSCVVRSLVI